VPQTPPSAPVQSPSTARLSSSLSGLCAIALPIGNVSDLSPHARAELESADLVAAEDTRLFHELVARAQIHLKKDARVFSYHDHNERESAPELIKLMKGGNRLALVSDAGTPNISDPGHHLLQLCFQNDIRVTGIPGPCSLTLVLSVCPIGGNSFSFHGFFPSGAAEASALLARLPGVVSRAVFFASPHRLVQDLETIEKLWPSSEIFIGRELTKQYEEFLSFSVAESVAHFRSHPPRGEFVFVLAIPDSAESLMSREALTSAISSRMDEGMTARDLRSYFTGMSKLSRQELYDLIEEVKKLKAKGDN
jgi:16S rRNA (cytidine1402-2'-O)-methyltransferase